MLAHSRRRRASGLVNRPMASRATELRALAAGSGPVAASDTMPRSMRGIGGGAVAAWLMISSSAAAGGCPPMSALAVR